MQFCSVLYHRTRARSAASMSLFSPSSYSSPQLFVKLREAGMHVERDSFLFLQTLKPLKLSLQVPVSAVTVLFQLHKQLPSGQA